LRRSSGAARVPVRVRIAAFGEHGFLDRHGVGARSRVFHAAKFLESSVRVFGYSPLLFAWIPPILMAIVALTLIARLR
jgi:hypothetical protein